MRCGCPYVIESYNTYSLDTTALLPHQHHVLALTLTKVLSARDPRIGACCHTTRVGRRTRVQGVVPYTTRLRTPTCPVAGVASPQRLTAGPPLLSRRPRIGARTLSSSAVLPCPVASSTTRAAYGLNSTHDCSQAPPLRPAAHSRPSSPPPVPVPVPTATAPAAVSAATSIGSLRGLSNSYALFTHAINQHEKN